MFLILLACGSPNTRKDLQNLPSLIEIVELNLNQNSIKLRVSHRNNLPREQNQLSCQLAIKDQQVIKLPSLNVPDLTTFATETIQATVDFSPLNIGSEPINSLPFVLDCYLSSETFRKEHIITESTIYLVPGKENRYR